MNSSISPRASSAELVQFCSDGGAKEQLEEVLDHFHWSHLVHTSVELNPQMGARDESNEFVRSPRVLAKGNFGLDSFD